MVGSDVISANAVSLSLSVNNGSGRIAETIYVPVRITEIALNRGTNRFSYVRIFSSPNTGSLRTAVHFTITTEAGADFGIQRIELYFDNGRAETTVKRNHPNLKAFANIRFVGSGLLQGYWEVDGRLINTINRHLTFAQSATLHTPDIPPLPTFDPGSHILRFVITNPKTEIPIPSIIYFVIPEEAQCSSLDLQTTFPRDSAKIAYDSIQFAWKPAGDADIFLISFYEQSDEKPIFSAYTKVTSYTISSKILENFFSKGKTYYWNVKGFDIKNTLTCESSFQSFSFEE
jgi:hypothetical protein